MTSHEYIWHPCSTSTAHTHNPVAHTHTVVGTVFPMPRHIQNTFIYMQNYTWTIHEMITENTQRLWRNELGQIGFTRWVFSCWPLPENITLTNADLLQIWPQGPIFNQSAYIFKQKWFLERSENVGHTFQPSTSLRLFYDDVIKWKHFPFFWPFVWEVYRSPVNSPNKDQWRGTLVFCLICAWKKRLSKQS